MLTNFCFSENLLAQKYYLAFESRLNFFFKWSYSQRCFDVAQRCLIQRWNTQRCFNVVERCEFQRWRTQRCFNVDLTLCDVATSYQPKGNVEPTLKCLLGTSFQSRKYKLLQNITLGCSNCYASLENKHVNNYF